MMYHIRSCAPLALVAALLFTPADTLAADAAGDATRGKAAYTKHGCWACHGFVGQGGAAGPKLAPDPKPYEVLAVFIRHSAGPMPPYTETILSNADLGDIYAYLKSIPKGADYKSIPQLN
ncbi:MAG: cytochrome c [Proteobacteria bacterium]|nr:cytochrome c [Pseudomonadota bacterium]